MRSLMIEYIYILLLWPHFDKQMRDRDTDTDTLSTQHTCRLLDAKRTCSVWRVYWCCCCRCCAMSNRNGHTKRIPLYIYEVPRNDSDAEENERNGRRSGKSQARCVNCAKRNAVHFSKMDTHASRCIINICPLSNRFSLFFRCVRVRMRVASTVLVPKRNRWRYSEWNVNR